MGSLHFVDEMKFFLNGQDIDPSGSPSHWISGEPGTGRWENEYDLQTSIRKGYGKDALYIDPLTSLLRHIDKDTPDIYISDQF